VIDDSVLFQSTLESYIAVVNAGKGEEVARHLTAHASAVELRVTDLSGRVGKIDLQGPDSARILFEALDAPERALRDMTYFSFTGHFDGASSTADTFFKGAIPVMVSRTGFTGELGFEIFVKPEKMVETWELILTAGEEYGLLPCGLAARDSLRAGAVLPLSGQDIGPWPFINHPWHHALPFDKEERGFTKRFVGDVVLEMREEAECTQPFAGYDPRKVSIHDPAVVLGPTGDRVGVVLTCVADMAIGRAGDRIYSIVSPDKPAGFKAKGLSCGLVRVKRRLTPGQVVELKDNRRKIQVEIVEDVRPDRTAFRPISVMI
jgi:aminomethyltransferase